MAVSSHVAREQSGSVQSIFISILPPHLAPVTWLSVSGSCGAQHGLIMRFPRLRLTPPLCHGARLTWRLPPRPLSPCGKWACVIVVQGFVPSRGFSPLKHLAWIIQLGWELLPVSVGRGRRGQWGSWAWPPSRPPHGHLQWGHSASRVSALTRRRWPQPGEQAGRDREILQTSTGGFFRLILGRDRDIDSLSHLVMHSSADSCCALTGDRTRSLGLCGGRRSNQLSCPARA